MLSPAIPANELIRQEVLDNQELLDTPADPYLDVLVKVVGEMFEVKTVLISLIDRDRQWFKARRGLEIPETPRSVSFCGHAILQDDLFLVEDTHQDPRFADNPVVTNPPFLRFYAGQPLYAQDGHAIGTLCLLHPAPKHLNKRQKLRFKDMATLAEGYLKLRHMSEQTQQLRAALSREQRKTMLDTLTQVWNRAGLEHFLPREQTRAEERDMKLGLLFCDLDYFKRVNDAHGHDAGDKVLWESARRIAAAVRPQDVVTRSGGEEFVVLTHVHDEQELRLIGERIRAAVAREPIDAGEVELQLTISIGSAVTQPQENPEQALKRADKALYHAKGNGRNRVEFAAFEAKAAPNSII
ncbi:sensor domain-containing diguanylate cyclase [Pseudomonas sp. GV071]|jgi:diguanylate cyclase (GGDEF)-like protein|uniref:sensor domain-containing diguanylate cyclase n=1 Tax=Pseudomonas sp. GV071 TaxID=2135754 RepID=UPI000D364B14|nr:sensor domain-containing diguanylate cyclase [Pseudomonas sp. GV071]PTQ71079.1 diguanylate cyclase with GAF sensor [Pseudomonas sp. GV071]